MLLRIDLHLVRHADVPEAGLVKTTYDLNVETPREGQKVLLSADWHVARHADVPKTGLVKSNHALIVAVAGLMEVQHILLPADSHLGRLTDVVEAELVKLICDLNVAVLIKRRRFCSQLTRIWCDTQIY